MENKKLVEIFDNKGEPITEVTSIVVYQDGIVVGTPKGLYTNVVAIDSQKDCDGEDEVYCNWYKCPSCKNTYVRNRDNYCSDCGCKFEWSGE